MNFPNSPTTSVPPPLPQDYNFQSHLQPKPKTRLILTESRAVPYRKATAVIGLFSLVASLLTFQVGWGINLPLVSAAALGVGFWRKPEFIHENIVRLQLAVWLALAVAVVNHFDPWTVIPFILVSAILLGSLLFGRVVDPMRGLARALVQIVAIPWSCLKAIRFGHASFGRKDGLISSVLRLTAFPIFIAIGFGTLYVWSNRALSQWSFNFFDNLLAGDWFADTFQFGWSLFLSSVVGAGLVYAMKKQDGRLLKSIGITPSKLAESASDWSSVSVALVLVNVLALVLNTVDGATTWMGEISNSAVELTRGVHGGTYTLITAVVLAAGYLLYNFKVQPKDYERARILAMAWLGQNLMMCFTVALRNYHYTDAYGLTVKRIGVWLFLCCTAIGLYFLGRQVRENGSVERLVRRQSWAVYLVLATAALPNWPGLITRYNYQEARMVLDEEYLWSLHPYNIDVWAEYDEEIVRRASHEYFAFTEGWFSVSQDFREWDYRSSRRAALKRALPLLAPVSVQEFKVESTLMKDASQQVDKNELNTEPVIEVETYNSPSK